MISLKHMQSVPPPQTSKELLQVSQAWGADIQLSYSTNVVPMQMFP